MYCWISLLRGSKDVGLDRDRDWRRVMKVVKFWWISSVWFGRVVGGELGWSGIIGEIIGVDAGTRLRTVLN